MLNLSYMQIIYLIHVLFVAPILIYVGLKRNSVNVRMFDLLLILGITVLVYHGYKLLKNTNNHNH